jgi:hypothetical protein
MFNTSRKPCELSQKRRCLAKLGRLFEKNHGTKPSSHRILLAIVGKNSPLPRFSDDADDIGYLQSVNFFFVTKLRNNRLSR